MKNTQHQNNSSPIKEVKERILAVHGDSVIIDESTYEGIAKKARFIHKKWGEWWPYSVYDVLRGTTHPKEKHLQSKLSKIIPLEEVERRLFKTHGEEVKIIKNTYEALAKKATFIDIDYGTWDALVSNVLNGGGHPDRFLDENRTHIRDVKTVLFKTYGDLIKIKEETYYSVDKKAKFIDAEYGEFECRTIDVLKQKGSHPSRKMDRFKKTCLEKYGVEYPSQNKESALKAAKKGNLIHIKEHWKTKEELICKAAWEARVVDYLNTNKINFEWQPQIFKIPKELYTTKTGGQATYRPDLYLIEKDVWVEIKGYFRGDSEKKWNWFKSEHPTAELWDKKKLKEMGIL